MKPIDQNRNMNVQLNQFFQFAISWGEKIKQRWNPVDHCDPEPISLKGLPEAIKNYIEIGWRFPFFEGIHFHLEWLSNDYFILDWKVGLKKCGGKWEVWNHEYDEEEKIPTKQLDASIEQVILELGLFKLMSVKSIVQQDGTIEWKHKGSPRILSETLKESKIFFKQQIQDIYGLSEKCYLSENQWLWHKDEILVLHRLVPELEKQELKVQVTCPKIFDRFINAGCSELTRLYKPK